LNGYYYQQIGSNTNWLFVQVNDKNEIEFSVTYDISTPDAENFYDSESGFDVRGLEEALSEICYDDYNITEAFSSLLAKLFADSVIEL
jgi:hypothetical protein